MTEKRFSVVLCTRNRAGLLAEALASIARIDYPASELELVLVDNASSDDTPAVAARFAASAPFSVRVVREEKLGLSAARNRAIREARGEQLFFTDDDQLVDPAVLSEHDRVARRFGSAAQQGGIALCFTKERPAWLVGELAEVLGETKAAEEGPGEVQLYGGNMLLARALLEAIGGFREDLGKGARVGYSEDTELTMRLLARGERIVYAPTALIHHVIGPDRATAAFFRRNAFEKGYAHGVVAGSSQSLALRASRTVRGLFEDAGAALVSLPRGDVRGLIQAQTRAASRLGWMRGALAARRSKP